MDIRYLATAFAVAVALTVAAPAFAKNDKAKGNKGGGFKVERAAKNSGKKDGEGAVSAAAAAAGATLASVLLSDQDKATITQYFAANPEPAKPLPPGIAKNVERGKPIPPGIAKRGVPGDLSRQLTIPKGFDLETIGNDIVLIEQGTRIIADVLKDVLRN